MAARRCRFHEVGEVGRVSAEPAGRGVVRFAARDGAQRRDAAGLVRREARAQELRHANRDEDANQRPDDDDFDGVNASVTVHESTR